MFSVSFIKSIVDSPSPDSSARFAVLRRKDKIPFVPAVGQQFLWATEQLQRVISVTWSFEDSTFECKLENEYIDDVDIDAFEFDELVEEAPSRGWEVVGVFPAP